MRKIMRSPALRGAALALSLTLVTPVLIGSAEAASSAHPSASHTAGADRATGKLELRLAAKHVQSDVAGDKVTALPGRQSHGKVRFVLKGVGLKQARTIKVTRGRAIFELPPLDAGSYRITATFKNLKGKTTFEVGGAA